MALTAAGLPRESTNAEAAHNALLGWDLRKRGSGALPDQVAQTPVGIIPGPAIVQLGKVVDAAQPKRILATSSAALLVVPLTDGQATTSGAVLHGSVPGLTTQTLPGTKMRLQGATIRHGLIVLEHHTCAVRVPLITGRLHHATRGTRCQRPHVHLRPVPRSQAMSPLEGHDHERCTLKSVVPWTKGRGRLRLAGSRRSCRASSSRV